MTAQDSGFSDMELDWPVFASDGNKLGEVKDIQGGYFKIAAPRQQHFWLRTSDISSTSSDRVVMQFDTRHLRGHKTDDPAKRAA
jgi:hypothetical protein